MSFPLGTKVKLKKESKYYYQCQHRNKIYEGTIVATKSEAYPEIRMVSSYEAYQEFDVRVVWDFNKIDDGYAYFYHSVDDLLPVNIDNNQDALGLLSTEEAW